MNQPDEKLSTLLKQWRGIEPKANFETDVWRRIRLAQTEEPERVSLIDVLRQLLGRPTLAVSTAAIVSVTIGVSGGLLTASKSTAMPRSEMSFMSTDTLAGGYVRLATERGR